jgi:CBS domain-containing protein
MAISWVGLRGIHSPPRRKATAGVVGADAPDAVPPDGPEREQSPKDTHQKQRKARPSALRRRSRALRAYASTEKQTTAEAGLLVARVMSAPVLTILHRTTAETAHELMSERGVRQAPVVNADKELIGMISEREILQAYQRYAGTPLPTVGEIMTRGALSATPDTPLREVAREMASEDISCVVVINGNHRVVGIVTAADILRSIVERAFMKDWI